MAKFPQDIIDAAQANEAKLGIPASATLAQWALESGYGKAESGKNNFGGITAKVKNAVFPDKPGEPLEAATLCWTREVVKGKSVRCQRYFKDFDSVAAFFEAHGKLLATSKYYAEARSKLPDVLAFVDALDPQYKATDPNWKAYATDPNYAETLRSIIRTNNLRQYDKMAEVAAPEPVVIAPPAITLHVPEIDPEVLATAALNKASLAKSSVQATALAMSRDTVNSVMAAAPANTLEHVTEAAKLKLGEKSTWIGGAILVASMAADPTVQLAIKPVLTAIAHGSWGGILSAIIGLGMVIARSKATPRTDAVLAAKRLAGLDQTG